MPTKGRLNGNKIQMNAAKMKVYYIKTWIIDVQMRYESVQILY